MEEIAAAHWQHQTRLTGNLLMASYEHRLSRRISSKADPDVQIHSHIITINATNIDGRWVALRACRLFHERHHLTEFYRNVLARRIDDLGYRIAGVSQETINKFSQRHFQIADRLCKRQKERNSWPTRIDELNIARQTREKKDLGVSPLEMKQRQLDRLTPSERVSLKHAVEKASERRHKLRLHISDDACDEGPRLKHWNYGQRISM
jgi:conjugative relaxase-like TrwC/TraI family protein